MYGPEGDLLLCEVVTYEIAYENVGEGEAIDVFIANKVPLERVRPGDAPDQQRRQLLGRLRHTLDGGYA